MRFPEKYSRPEVYDLSRGSGLQWEATCGSGGNPASPGCTNGGQPSGSVCVNGGGISYDPADRRINSGF